MMENTQTICSTNSRFHTFGNTIFMGPKHGTSKNVSILMVGMGGAFRHLEVTGRTMKIPFRINDDIIISNNDKDNDVPNGCLINTSQARLGRTQ